MELLLQHSWIIWLIHILGLAGWIFCQYKYRFGLTFMELFFIWAIAGPIIGRFRQDSLAFATAYLIYLFILLGIPLLVIVRNELKYKPNKSVHPTAYTLRVPAAADFRR